MISAERHGRAGFTAIELLTVILVLGLLTAVASPSMISFYRHRQLDAAAMELSSTLRFARSLSINRDEGRQHGMVIFPDGRFGSASWPAGSNVNAANLLDQSRIRWTSEMGFLGDYLHIEGMDGAPDPRWILFRNDGIPSMDGINIPISAADAEFRLTHDAVAGERIIRLSRSSGLPQVE